MYTLRRSQTSADFPASIFPSVDLKNALARRLGRVRMDRLCSRPLRIGAALLFLWVATSPLWAAGPPVVVAVPAAEEGLTRIQQWEPIVSALRQASGLNIELAMAKDEPSIRKGIEQNLFDIAFVDPVWFVILDREELSVPLARVVVGGSSLYRSLLIVRKDSIIRSLRDLQGKSVALTTPFNSAVGYFVPLAMLADESREGAPGPAPTFVYSDTSLSVLKAVSYGNADAGFVSSSLFEDQRYAPLLDRVRVVRESNSIAQWTVVARRGLREDLALAVKDALLAMHASAAGNDALSNAGFDRFIETPKSDYETARGYYESLESKLAVTK